MRKEWRTPASRPRIVSRSAPVELTVLLRTITMRSGSRQCELPLPNRKLDCDSRPNVGPLRNGDVYFTGNTWRGWFSNDVKQNFANLTSAGSDRISFFVLQRVNLSICVQGKDYWFRVHVQKSPSPPVDSCPSRFFKQYLLSEYFQNLELSVLVFAAYSCCHTNKTGSQQ